MKVFSAVMKVAVALAAVAGAVYVAATYGDKIVAWCKKMLGSCPCCCGGECECDCEDADVEVEIVPAEEAPAEEAPAEEAPAAEASPVAEETDFVG